MALDVTAVWNKALSAAGGSNMVDTIDEVSRERELCDLWYEVTRDSVLRAAPWNCAEKSAYLALTDTRDQNVAWAAANAQPNWTYTYALPNDFLYPRFTGSYSQFFLTGNSLLSNEPSAILTYTFRQTNPNAWDADLELAIVHSLAGAIAMSLHGKTQRTLNQIQLGNAKIMEARERNANMREIRYDHVPPWIAARGGSSLSSATPYIYPYGPLISNDGLPATGVP